MAIKQSKLQHVVAVPYPAQGHINPMLQLCHQLVPHGFTFTFVNTNHIHERVQKSANPTDNRLAQYSHTLHVQHQDANVHHPNHAIGSNLRTEYYADSNGVSPHENGGHNIMEIHSHHGPNGCDPIRMAFVEGGCAPEQHAHISTSKEAIMAAQEMKEQVEQLISNIMEEQPVAFILTDILCGWGSATANKFGLPWVCFWPASAATCATLKYIADLSVQGKLIPVAGKQDGEVPVIEDIPGMPPTRLDEMPKLWDDTGKLSHEVVKYFAPVKHASFLLLNTFTELEGQVLQALSRCCPTLPVGPLIPSRFMIHDGVDTCPDKRMQLGSQLAVSSRPSLFREDRTCLDWLDMQASSSVLFISFGSISARTEEQLEELAHGVESSGCPFLWVRRPDTSAVGVDKAGAPQAAAAQKHGQTGLVVSWAPQLEVLSHPAVGGFVTHCGWNSVMESVAMGVPMLCWADTGERMSNQRFVVQFWKCGLDMVADSSRRFKQHVDEAVLVTREEISRSIRCLMKEEESGAPIRARAAHLRDLAICAFHNSPSQFDHFAQAIVDLKAPHPTL